jgi:hypothetical protein
VACILIYVLPYGKSLFNLLKQWQLVARDILGPLYQRATAPITANILTSFMFHFFLVNFLVNLTTVSITQTFKVWYNVQSSSISLSRDRSIASSKLSFSAFGERDCPGKVIMW